jgi:hypothetical protein
MGWLDMKLQDNVRVIGLPNSEWQGLRGTVVEIAETIGTDQRVRPEYAVEFMGKGRRWFLPEHLVRSVPEKRLRFFRYEVMERWNQLDADDVAVLHGDCGELINLLQDRYDFTTRRAQAEVENFFSEFESKIASAVAPAASVMSTEAVA